MLTKDDRKQQSKAKIDQSESKLGFSWADVEESVVEEASGSKGSSRRRSCSFTMK